MLFYYLISIVVVVLYGNINKTIDREDLIAVYKMWLTSPYDYMFALPLDETSGERVRTGIDTKLNYIKIGNKVFTTYMGGINGILYYGSLVDAISRHFYKTKPQAFDDISPIERLSGYRAYIDTKEAYKYDFEFINSDIIKWGIINLIAEPEDKIYDKTCKEIYDVVFSRFVRLMTESYLWLKNNNINKEIDNYKKWMEFPGDMDVFEFLESRFKNKLMDYEIERDGTFFTPAMAFGFWLRRAIDKTDSLLWYGLKIVLKKYDNKWLNSLKDKYSYIP